MLRSLLDHPLRKLIRSEEEERYQALLMVILPLLHLAGGKLAEGLDLRLCGSRASYLALGLLFYQKGIAGLQNSMQANLRFAGSLWFDRMLSIDLQRILAST